MMSSLMHYSVFGKSLTVTGSLLRSYHSYYLRLLGMILGRKHHLQGFLTSDPSTSAADWGLSWLGLQVLCRRQKCGPQTRTASSHADNSSPGSNHNRTSARDHSWWSSKEAFSPKHEDSKKEYYDAVWASPTQRHYHSYYICCACCA